MTNREFFLACSKDEAPRFVKVLRAVPGDQLGWRPHDRSRSSEELIGHLIGHEQDLVELLDAGTINHRMQVPFAGIDDAVSIYERAHRDVEAKVTALDDAAWEQPAQFLVEGNVIMEAPRGQLAWLMMFDAIHHRGQLSTHIRPSGGSVPSIYGPSADDGGPAH